jgi:hypothetical protein
MQPSAMFRTVCMFLQLSAVQANTWRLALSQAPEGLAQAWAAAVEAFDLEPPHGPDKLTRVEPFLRETSPPARVVAVLESLVEARLLTRREATAIEENIFQCLDAQGAWFWDA